MSINEHHRSTTRAPSPGIIFAEDFDEPGDNAAALAQARQAGFADGQRAGRDAAALAIARLDTQLDALRAQAHAAVEQAIDSAKALIVAALFVNPTHSPRHIDKADSDHG